MIDGASTDNTLKVLQELLDEKSVHLIFLHFFSIGVDEFSSKNRRGGYDEHEN